MHVHSIKTRICHILKTKCENIFLIFCLFWGILLTFINPLFQSFDEPEHFYKIYAFSEGTMNFRKITSYTDGTLMFNEPKTFTAQIIPVSIVQIIVENKKLNPYFDENKILHKPQKLKVSEAIQQSHYALNKHIKTLAVHVIPSYTIASYLPHTVTLAVLKQFNIPPAAMVYLLRLCSLFLYIALMYTAIKITPVKKYLFLFLSLTPLSVYLSATINTDHLVIGLGFLLIAYTLRLKYSENINTINSKHLAIFFTIIFFLCLCKFIYLPMILLFFLIPKEKFESQKQQLIYFTGIATACIAWICTYIFYNMHIFKGTFSYFCRDTAEAIRSILVTPLAYISGIINTVKINSIEYTQRIFSDFGCSDTQISTGLIYSYVILILFNTIFTDKQKQTFNLKEKLLFALIILAVFVITLTANFVIFTPSPEGLIEGFKGRYLIPVLPLFFMLFDNNKLKPLNINLPLIAMIYALFLVFVFSVTLFNRYYI